MGLVSYDPRQGPRFGIIGYNGILPPYRQRGYGTQQIVEALRIFRARGYERAQVSTSEHPFFRPARCMYEACGFQERGRTEQSNPPSHCIICYEMLLVV